MNDNLGANIKCPFYIRHGRSEKVYSVTCWPLMTEDQLGFRYDSKVGFYTKQDFIDYTELFCCDMYRTCPQYNSIIANRRNLDDQEEKEKL